MRIERRSGRSMRRGEEKDSKPDTPILFVHSFTNERISPCAVRRFRLSKLRSALGILFRSLMRSKKGPQPIRCVVYFRPKYIWIDCLVELKASSSVTIPVYAPLLRKDSTYELAAHLGWLLSKQINSASASLLGAGLG